MNCFIANKYETARTDPQKRTALTCQIHHKQYNEIRNVCACAVCEVRILSYYFISQKIHNAEKTQTNHTKYTQILTTHTHTFTKSIKEEKAKEKLLFCTDLT